MARTKTFQDWYRRNRTALLRKRKRRYRTDPQYREGVKETAMRRYRTVVRRERPIDRRTIVTEDGARFVSIGRVSRMIGRETASIRRYHRMGVIPQPLFFDRRGWRLYSVDQVMLLRRVFRRLENPEDQEVRNLMHVRNLLQTEWAEGGGANGEAVNE